MAAARVFTRQTSGLVRELSVLDAAIVGLLGSVPVALIQYLFPVNMYFAPGANVPLAVGLGFLLCIPVYIVYAGLGSAMPRAGGDYIYQSRTLYPSIGFAITLGWNVFMNAAPAAAIGALVASTSGFSPVFTQMGAITGSEQLVALGTWCATPMGSFVAGLVGGIIPVTAIALAGPKPFRRLQRYVLLPGYVITPIGLSVLFLTTSHETFVNSFNAWGLTATGDPNLYLTVMNAATNAGFQTPALSWRMTLITMMLAYPYIVYAVLSAMGLLGEVKKAGNFKLLLTTYAAVGVYVSFGILIPMMWSFERVVGWDFMHALSYAYMAGLVNIPYLSYFWVASIMIGGSPIILLILSWGFLQAGLANITVPVVNSRQVVAMSLDGVLPEWFGRISRRYKSPMNAIMVITAAILVYMVLLNFWPEHFYFVIFNGYLFCAIAIMAVTALAAAVFPIRARGIFKSAPVARYGFLLPFAGIVGFVEICIISAMYLTLPELGLNLATSWAILLALPVILFVYFFVWRSYQGRKGIDIEVAFREVPPE